MAGTSRRQQLEAMLAEDPNDPLLRYMLAMEYVSGGNDAGAVDCFGELFQRAADYVPAYMQCGQALARLNRTGEARDVWQRGIKHAQQQGNEHAAGEMQGMLEGLE